MGSSRVTDEKLQRVLNRVAPVTLPVQAWGPVPVTWHDPVLPVWAWVCWPDRPAERIAGFAHGSNDRVVLFEWAGDGGTRQVVVWRNAVTRRGKTPTRR